MKALFVFLVFACGDAAAQEEARSAAQAPADRTTTSPCHAECRLDHRTCRAACLAELNLSVDESGFRAAAKACFAPCIEVARACKAVCEAPAE